MVRYLQNQIIADLERKMVFVAGPRQCGKTTLAKEILKKNKGTYLNWDNDEDRESLLRYQLPGKSQLLVFDEIHKYSRWRNWLKGIYDKHHEDYKILVTGSAKLDHYRKGGDSLQGRYHLLRLYPLSFAELKNGSNADLMNLFHSGPFPEPFYSKSADQARRWSREYRTRLIRDEVTALEKINEISLLERLAHRLPECVGSPLSVNSLREDLQLAHHTVSRWIDILENLYSIFRVYPFGSPKIRAVKKEYKHYHFDWNLIADEGARFENMVGFHLLKYAHFIEDTKGYEMELRYFKDKERREVDFVLMQDQKPIHFVEVKLSDKDSSPSLRYLKNKFPHVSATQVQLKHSLDVIDRHGIRVCHVSKLFEELV